MPSGKQILTSLLAEYSQKQTEEDELPKVSDRVKAGMLLHGSTSNSMWKMMEELAWMSHSHHEEGEPVTSQGLALESAQLLLSDFFGALTQSEEIPAPIKEEYPEITAEAYKAGVHSIWLLLKSLEWSKNHEEVEQNGQLDIKEKERFLESYQRKLKEYREDPEDYS